MMINFLKWYAICCLAVTLLVIVYASLYSFGFAKEHKDEIHAILEANNKSIKRKKNIAMFIAAFFKMAVVYLIPLLNIIEFFVCIFRIESIAAKGIIDIIYKDTGLKLIYNEDMHVFKVDNSFSREI